MDRFVSVSRVGALVMLLAVELIAVGMGMGVPFFAIVAGLPIGWFLARRAMVAGDTTHEVLRRSLVGAAVASAFTFVQMIAIWGPKFSLLSQEGFDAAAWGIPLVLYTSTASFLGWQALMIVVSPVLQVLVSTFASYLTVLRARPSA